MQLPQTAAWVPLRNSERPIPPGGKWLGPVDPSEPIMVTIRVRPGVGTGSRSPGATDSGHLREPSGHRWQEPGEVGGADPGDLDRVQEFAGQAGFDIIELSLARRSLVVWGTAAAIAGAFRVELVHYDYAGNLRRGQIGPVYLPPTIAHIVQDVSGLDEGLPDAIATIIPSLRVPRFTSRQIAIPLLAFLVGSALTIFLFRTSAGVRSTPHRANPAAQSAAPRPTLHDLRLAEIESAAWKSLDAGRLRDAQDDFLRVLTLDPTRYTSMRGLVAVRRRMAGGDLAVIRQQVAVYRDAVKRGVAADEYAPSVLKALISASLTVVKELESPQESAGAAAPNRSPGPPGAPSKPAGERVSANGKLPHPKVTDAKPAPVQKLAASDGRLPQPAIPVKAALRTSVPPATPVDKQPVAAAPQGLSIANAPVASQPASPASAPPPPTSPPVPTPRPTSAGGPAATPPSNHLYMVRIGPLTDRDRATAIAKQLSAGGFPQAQVNAQTGYRVLSEPLPRQAAEKLAATLAARGFRTSTDALTGDTVQLVFGVFASQKDAATLSGRIAAAGYDAWIREAPVYTVNLGPHPQATVTIITDMVRASAPDTTVAATDASSQASPTPAAAPRVLAPPPAASPQAPAGPPAVSGQSPRPAPVRQASTPPANPLYVVRIGPVFDHDRAATVAKQLSSEGFAQPQITEQRGYRVVSEPLPRKEAEDLVAALAGHGLRSYAESLTGDSVQLLFGVFASQKDAEALSSRIAAVGLYARIREGLVYTLRLGPYPQASVNAITGIVSAGAPEATVATDPVSTP